MAPGSRAWSHSRSRFWPGRQRDLSSPGGGAQRVPHLQRQISDDTPSRAHFLTYIPGNYCLGAAGCGAREVVASWTGRDRVVAVDVDKYASRVGMRPQHCLYYLWSARQRDRTTEQQDLGQQAKRRRDGGRSCSVVVQR